MKIRDIARRLMSLDLYRVEVDEKNYRVCVVGGIVTKQKVMCLEAPSGLGEKARAAYLQSYLAMASKDVRDVNRRFRIALLGTPILTVLLLLGIVPLTLVLFEILVALWCTMITTL